MIPPPAPGPPRASRLCCTRRSLVWARASESKRFECKIIIKQSAGLVAGAAGDDGLRGEVTGGGGWVSGKKGVGGVGVGSALTQLTSN